MNALEAAPPTARCAIIAAALALAACAFAPQARATNVTAYGPDTRFGFSGEIYISGTRGPNRITISYEPAGEAFVVTDPSGITTQGCEALTKTRARCTSPQDSFVQVTAREGRDRIQVAPSVRTGVDINGGSGGDLLIGGRFDDDLSGDRGEDILQGKGGDDDLGSLFDLGRDEFYGGGGNDDIDASEERSGPDKVINCGAGRQDDAFVDDKRDPHPAGCEEVVNT